MNSDTRFEYVGNLHVHSSFSDGAGTVPEIARIASNGGLDFVIINDHDFMTDALHLEMEGFYNGVLVLVGLEIGEKNHHYLAYDLMKMVKAGNLHPQEVIDQVNAQGGFGFLAHPFEKGMPFHKKSIAYTWDDLTVDGFTGICIWNFASRWKERIKTPLHGLFFLLFKSRLLKGPSNRTLNFWDILCQHGRVAAIGGSDAHGSRFKWGIEFTPLSYDYLLNSINIHILLDRELPKDFSEAKVSIYQAIKEGRLFIAHDKLAAASGFRFTYVSDYGQVLAMGEESEFQPGSIHIRTPLQSEIRLIRNGILQEKWIGQNVSWRIERRGVYRVEVYRRVFLFGWRHWIFSNPIYLR